MKLTAKIGVVFGATVLGTILAVGGITISSSFSMSTKTINDNLATSASLAAGQISGKFDDFLHIAEVTGEDPVISGEGTNLDKAERINELAEEYGFTSGNILDLNGVSIKDGTDFSDRAYVQNALAGEINISDISLSKLTDKYGCSIAAPIESHESEGVKGVVYYRMDNDFMDAIISNIKISENSYAFIVNAEGTIIVHSNADMIMKVNIFEQSDDMAMIKAAMESGESGSADYFFDGKPMSCGYSPIANTPGWELIVTAPKDDFMSSVTNMIKKSVIVDVIAIVLSLIIAFVLAGTIGKSASDVAKALVAISNGDFSNKVAKTTRKDEIGILQNAAHDLEHDFEELIGEANRVLGSMARYDLSASDMKDFPGEFDSLSNSINQIKEILGLLISEVQESASSVGVGSGQLASAADALSRGTVSQASSIDQVVVDVQDVTDRIRRNSDNEEVVEGKLKNLGTLISNGNNEMTELLHIVKEVEEMSADIQKIVGTIDSIAFQTNILALNASVEAARAGDNGKGFAVVADEVGALASKTSEASKQTSELIGRCIDRINQAMRSADTTFDCLKKIVENSNEISEAFEEIAHDTRQQAQKSVNIRQEMDAISDVVQTNTATAEETAAATQELSDQAKNLSELIAKFRI